MYHRPLTALAAFVAACLCTAVVFAAPPWCATPLAKWADGASFDQDYNLKPPFATWEEQEGALVARGNVDRWATKLHPQDLGGTFRVAVRFTVEASLGRALQLPGGCIRWGFHWGENLPGWDLAVVLGYQDPLDFCRVQVSGSRNELALWDAAGGFLQLIPVEIGVGIPHELEVMAVGPHYRATLDGKPVMDYWNRSVTPSGGRSGLAVCNSAVRFADFETGTVATFAAEKMPPHKPDFHFRPCGPTAFGGTNGLVVFDGDEPISVYSITNQGSPGVLYQDMIRLKPGWRSAYYTFIGPGINTGVNGQILPLAGKLPDAFKVEKEGEQLVFTFRTEAPDLAYTDQTCTVRYDTAREVYRYEYQGHTQWTTKEPYALTYMELTDPLTYNNRAPGAEVVNRWNFAGHQWWVLQGTGGAWQRSPLIDYLGNFNGHAAAWPTSSDFLYPDPVACPAWETTLLWDQPDKRSYDVGMCHWGYDFHHTEEGYPVTLPVGTQRDYTMAFTALPAAEARKVFDQSVVAPKIVPSPGKYPVFNAAGTTFDKLSTRRPPPRLWSGTPARWTTPSAAPTSTLCALMARTRPRCRCISTPSSSGRRSGGCGAGSRRRGWAGAACSPASSTATRATRRRSSTSAACGERTSGPTSRSSLQPRSSATAPTSSSSWTAPARSGSTISPSRQSKTARPPRLPASPCPPASSRALTCSLT